MRLSLASLVALAVLAVGTTTADAYPQFQFALGSDRCSACHFAPGGGGLLNDLGRDEAGEGISGRGDGRFAHGGVTLPSWLALGADFRFALGGKQLADRDPTLLAFPMQADTYSRAAFGPISLNLTVGLNGAARSRTPGASVASYVASRQHYLMYESGSGNVTVRAGRFFPVFGLRSQDHTAYPRRYLDQSTLEEPYAVELGASGNNWEGYLAGFLGNPIPYTGSGAKASGATAYYERRFGAYLVAGNARVAQTDDDRRVTAGAIGKYWFEKPGLMAIGELDLQRQSFATGGTTRLQLLGFAQLTKLILPGYMIGAALQRWDPDLSLRGSTRNAFQLDVQAFPWAHVEAHLLTRLEATGGDTTHPNLLALLQLHYYL
ncbi:MAG: hypothetical protein IPQ07_22210 [Myxococcales bacterium]|nr:hypothetical protein [Myxococcales bacterium]